MRVEQRRLHGRVRTSADLGFHLHVLLHTSRPMSDTVQELERLRALLPHVMAADAWWAQYRFDGIAARVARGQPVERVVGEIAQRDRKSVV